MGMRRRCRGSAVLLAGVVVVASCGSGGSGGTAPTEATASVTTDLASDDEGRAGGGDVTAGEGDMASSDGDIEVTYGGELIVGLEAEAQGLRPWADAASSSAVNMMNAIYDQLMKQTADGDVQGYLAESIVPNEDFTVWTMTLRPGVTFSNGAPLTAQTIADMFPIQQTGATASAAIAATGLTGVEATGELEVTYTLAAPNSAFASALTNPTLGMPFDPAAAAADPAGFSANPVGTGPFVVESRDIDNETVVVRRDDYWFTTADGNRLPYVDTVSFRPIADEGTRLDALVSGTSNAMTSLRGATIRDARANSDGLTLVEFQGNTSGGGMYNTAMPPFDDVRVRRGLTAMVDSERLIDASGGTGISVPATQWYSPDSPYWTQEAADSYRGFDFDAGRASLQQYIDDPNRSDGKATGERIEVTLSCPPDPTLIATMQVIEQVWTGSEQVDVTLAQFDQATHVDDAITDRHQAHCWRFSGQGDPGATLAPFVADPATSAGNLTNFSSPTMQEAVRVANRTDDLDERRALFSEVMQEINDQALLWYGGHTTVLIATDDDVRGVDDWELPDGTLGSGIPDAVAMWSQVFITK